MDGRGGWTRWSTAEAERAHGVIVTSAKKTFFAGGDLRTLMAPARRRRRSSRTRCTPVKAAVAPAGDSRPPGRGRPGRHCARRRLARSLWPATTASPWTAQGPVRAAGGDARAAPRRRRRNAYRAHARPPAALQDVLLTGAQVHRGRALDDGLVDEMVGEPRGSPRGQGVDRGNPDAEQPGIPKATAFRAARARPPLAPCARVRPMVRKSSRAHRPGPAEHRGGRGRRCSGRPRHRGHDRDDVLGRADHRSDCHQHDPRPCSSICRPSRAERPARWSPSPRGRASDRGGRRDDGRRNRLLCAWPA